MNADELIQYDLIVSMNQLYLDFIIAHDLAEDLKIFLDKAISQFGNAGNNTVQ